MDFIAITAGIVGMIWGVVAIRHSGLIGGCLLVLLAGACFSVPFFKFECGPAPLTADRLLLALLCVQYVVWRRRGLADPKPIGKPDIALFLFLGVLVLSTFLHDWRALGTTTPYLPVAWLTINYLMPGAMYWVARQTKFGEHEAKLVLGSFAFFGVYLAVVSLAEYAWQSAGWATSWLVQPAYIVTSSAAKDAEFVGRARGPLLNAIGNGILLTVCMSATLLWWPRLRRVGRLLLIGVAALSLAAMYCSLTRSVWMSAALALVLLIVPALPRQRRWPLVIGGALVAVALAATQWESLLAFKRDKTATAAEAKMSVELRPVLARIAWNMFCDRPLFGVGYGQYGVESLAYASGYDSGFNLALGRNFIQHNVFLSLLTETGAVGLALFLMVLGFWLRNAWQLCRDAAAPLWARQFGLWFFIAFGAYAINGMFHEVSVIAMMNMMLFFIAGIVAGLNARNNFKKDALARHQF